MSDEPFLSLRSILDLPYPVHDVIDVRWLMAAGLCSAACLLAYRSEDCDCCCFGRYHGRLKYETIGFTAEDREWGGEVRWQHAEPGIQTNPGYASGSERWTFYQHDENGELITWASYDDAIAHRPARR
jgi:hypothetical protein